VLVPVIPDSPYSSVLKLASDVTWTVYRPLVSVNEPQLRVSEADWSVAPFVGDDSVGWALALMAHAIRQVADRAALFNPK